MADPERATDARFAAVVQALGRRPGVTHSATTSRLFGSTALKVYDKIFAMVSSEGHFVVKLPKARVDALVGNGAGQRFQANRGRPMNEWLEVHSIERLGRARPRGLGFCGHVISRVCRRSSVRLNALQLTSNADKRNSR